MTDILGNYIQSLDKRYRMGISTEHTFRSDLQILIEKICPDVVATNEPTRIDCGAPDFIVTKRNIPVGYLEAKDIGIPLDGKDIRDQINRYKSSLPNLFVTDYLNFWLYRDGELIAKICIGETLDKKVKPIRDQFEPFIDLIKDFCAYTGQTITSSNKLSKMMAGKAKLLARIIDNALTSEEKNDANSTLREQMIAFRKILIHDITPKEFADIYAQTIAYGMFAARLHDETLENFTRQEAAQLIPKSNPFLRKLFQYIAGYDLDDRIVWIVDALADIFRATDVKKLMENFGSSTQQNDPVIHFYETFLAEYDPKLRKSRGVWYTPEPVVQFIVRAVDEILKDEFGLSQGLADTTKTKIAKTQITKATADKRSKVREVKEEVEVHKVQILDPATGTATFLSEVIKLIYSNFIGQEGIWTDYVERHLIPRLNGFELLMASYAMAHLKLELLLKETGFKPKNEQRLRVYLTNSLEEHHPETGTLFANWLSTEANEANHVKRDTPVMCIIGNPPYSVSSSNRGGWITQLMKDYKKEPDGIKNLAERNSKIINDDYVKFIRYGQHLIEKNGSGVLAYINPHGFLGNPTFRGMRWSVLNTFDKIYTIDLHGNAKKKEIAKDGSPDVNVFDIQQGVSINIFLKTPQKQRNGPGKVYHFDLFGPREKKYKFLETHSLNAIAFTEISNKAPMYYMIPKNFEGEKEYLVGFQLSDLFPINTSGIKTHRDAFVIDINKEDLTNRIKSFFNPDVENEEILSRYQLKANMEWLSAKRKGQYNSTHIKKITYRPFDDRWIYFSKDLVDRGRFSVMNQYMEGENLGIGFNRQIEVNRNFFDIIVTTELFTLHSLSLKEGNNFAPLYLYHSQNDQKSLSSAPQRTPNLNAEIIKLIESSLDLTFTTERQSKSNTFCPLDLIDYVYAVLHSPTYRDRFKEFLKIDFPRVPYPNDKYIFWQLVKFGSQLRLVHLMQPDKLNNYISNYPKTGDNIILRKINPKDWEYSNPEKDLVRVWINDIQYFDNIPSIAWEFYIGGYQPAQKWLKDRYGRQLSFDDIVHYQKIIVVLNETNRIMQEIDEVIDL